MAWLTTLDTSKRINTRHSAKYVYYLIPYGGTGWQSARRLDSTDEYQYPGIKASDGPGLADSLLGGTTIDAYFQYEGGGGGSVIQVVQTQGAEEPL